MKLIELGEKIARRRGNLQLKQEDLAELASVTIKTIYQLESGKGNPSFSTLSKILHVLGLEIFVDIKKTGE